MSTNSNFYQSLSQTHGKKIEEGYQCKIYCYHTIVWSFYCSFVMIIDLISGNKSKRSSIYLSKHTRTSSQNSVHVYVHS